MTERVKAAPRCDVANEGWRQSLEPFCANLRSSVRLACVLSALCVSAARAQCTAPRQPASATSVFAANALVGALTSAGRAIAKGKSVRRAVVGGAIGGSLEFAAKSIIPRRGPDVGFVGVLVGAVGSSIVNNAGRGAGLLSEISVPFGPVRFRLRADSSLPVRIAVNAYEAAVLVRYATTPNLRFDLRQSARIGAPVFIAARRPIVNAVPRTADGATDGSVVVVFRYPYNHVNTLLHEMVHVHQQWFLQENVGLPIEGAIRRVPGLRWIPAWIDVGALSPALSALEREAFGFGKGPLVRLMQSEAEWFENDVGR